MKRIKIQKRKDLKYMPSYKYQSIGYHDNGMEWFNTCYKTKAEALVSAEVVREALLKKQGGIISIEY